jgi:sugar phosphate isomerase/epimerase
MAMMDFGLMVHVHDGMHEVLKQTADLGIPTCQISTSCEQLVRPGTVELMVDAAAKTSVRVSSVFFVFEGQTYNNTTGPKTDGLVPDEHRERRLELSVKAADLLKSAGFKSITSHIGFIPDDECDPLYGRFLNAMTTLAKHTKANGQIFAFETGQELPSTLLRTIHDIGTDNLFVNLDPANLVLYGKANPLDAVEIFGHLVRGVHGKDGVWPNRDEALGHETRLGDGAVNFAVLLRRLKAKGFAGPLTIEREISGPQQLADIRHAMDVLRPHMEL